MEPEPLEGTAVCVGPESKLPWDPPSLPDCLGCQLRSQGLSPLYWAVLCFLTSRSLRLPKLPWVSSAPLSTLTLKAHHSVSPGSSGYSSHSPVSNHLESYTKNLWHILRSFILAGKSGPKVIKEGKNHTRSEALLKITYIIHKVPHLRLCVYNLLKFESHWAELKKSLYAHVWAFKLSYV